MSGYNSGMEHQKIAILGAGSWGSALAFLLGGKGYPVTLWDRDAELVAQMQAQRRQPQVSAGYRRWARRCTATDSLREAVTDADWVIVAVASDGVRAVVAEAADFLSAQTVVLSAVQGPGSGDRLHDLRNIIDRCWPTSPTAGLAVLSGPNLAGELARGVPTASVVASDDPPLARARPGAADDGAHVPRLHPHRCQGRGTGRRAEERARHRRAASPTAWASATTPKPP